MNAQPPATPTPPDHQLTAESGERPRSKHRAWAWVLVFIVFGGIFWWVWHQKSDQAAAAGAGRRGATGPVTTVTAAATQGDIGVYQDAIGTVTPVYTDSIVSQVSGS
jgi:multidrug efflux system membrane fusion protein